MEPVGHKKKEMTVKKQMILWLVGVVAVGLLAGCVTSSKKCDMTKCQAMMEPGQTIESCPAFAGITLTADQKAKLQAMHEKCVQGGCTKKCCKAMNKEVKSVLTAEQVKQYDANIANLKKGCCKQKAEQKKVEKKVEQKVKKADDATPAAEEKK